MPDSIGAPDDVQRWRDAESYDGPKLVCFEPRLKILVGSIERAAILNKLEYFTGRGKRWYEAGMAFWMELFPGRHVDSVRADMKWLEEHKWIVRQGVAGKRPIWNVGPNYERYSKLSPLASAAADPPVESYPPKSSGGGEVRGDPPNLTGNPPKSSGGDNRVTGDKEFSLAQRAREETPTNPVDVSRGVGRHELSFVDRHKLDSFVGRLDAKIRGYDPNFPQLANCRGPQRTKLAALMEGVPLADLERALEWLYTSPRADRCRQTGVSLAQLLDYEKVLNYVQESARADAFTPIKQTTKPNGRPKVDLLEESRRVWEERTK